MSKDSVEKDEHSSESKRKQGLAVSFLKEASNSHLLVATLVATVSFAAGFTLPGGYNNKDGTPILKKMPALQAFVVFNFLALVSSVTAILCHFYGALCHKKTQLASVLGFAYWCTQLGIGAMMLAFVSNVYTMDPHQEEMAFSTYIILFGIALFMLFIMGKVKKYLSI